MSGDGGRRQEATEAFLELSREGGAVRSRGTAQSRLGCAGVGGEAPERPGSGWTWDGVELSAYTDRFGFHPLFYAVDGGRLLVSHSLTRLLDEGVPRALDYDALSVFLHLGWYLGEETPFRHIRVLPPSGRLIWSEGVSSVSGGATLTAANDLTFAQAVDAYVDLFRDAIRRSLDVGAGRISLPLSGGKDSRHILLALAELGRLPDECVTFHQLPWQEPNFDVPIAEELAQSYDVRHTVLSQAGAGHAMELEKNLATHLCSDEHAHYLVLREHLRRTPDAVVYDGIAGDVLSESKVRDDVRLRLYRNRDFEALVDLELGGPGYLPRLLGRAADWYSWDAVRERVRLEMSRYADAPNPFSAYRFWTRTRREIALSPFAILAGHTVHAPYVDSALYEMLSGLNGDLLTGPNRLHTTAMRTAYGDMKVPFDYERKTADLSRRYGSYRDHLARRRWKDLLQSRRWLAASLVHAAKDAPRGLFDRRYLVGRGALAFAARSSDAGGILPWLPRMLTYLTQVHQIAAGGRTA